MDMPTLQGIVNFLAQDLDLPVVLEDADQQPLVHSPHYDLTDQIRRDTILRHATGQQVVDYFRDYDLGGRAEPFVVPGDPDRDVLPRLCIPIRHLDAVLGYAWVLLPTPELTEQQLAAARHAAGELADVMRAEHHARHREAEAVADLISTDPDRRLRGLVAVGSRSAFEAPRRCAVLVCSGPAWSAASTRRAFWSIRWVGDPACQLRAASDDEGVAVVALADDATGGASRPGSGGPARVAPPPVSLEVAARGLDRLRRVADGQELVLGVGPAVGALTAAHVSHRHARQSARVALRAGRHGPVATWADLGIYRHLAQMPDEVLADGIDQRLVALVEDAPEIAATLEVYLDMAGAVSAVADALHVHRTTLYYRLEKVAEHGVDLRLGADRASMHAGFAAMRLLRWWPEGREKPAG